MMKHESSPEMEANFATPENHSHEVVTEVTTDTHGISAETVQPSSLDAYYTNRVQMGEDPAEMHFMCEEDFFKETGFKLSDVRDFEIE